MGSVLFRRYENGRISQHGNVDQQCKVLVNNTIDEDNGKWKCEVTYIDDTGTAVQAAGEVAVTVTSK